MAFIRRLFIANRGEIAIRIARAAAEHGVEAVLTAAADDPAPHFAAGGVQVRLPGAGVRAYLDGPALIAAARAQGCDALHPGYGFLSESAAFARACAEAGLRFVGPSPSVLESLGDKTRARALARAAGVPLFEGTDGAATLAQAQAFLASLGPAGAVMVKAAAGGGGRGMRIARSADELAQAYPRCASEAQAAFGSGELYVERLIARARHIEVQIAGDRTGAVVHLGDRDCTLQRRFQKLIEIAPAPALDPAVRARLFEAALALGRAAGCDHLCTVEFLLDAETGRFAFLEANPRLQVEHTVTEEVTGVDLVRLQLALSEGATLAELGLASPPALRGTAIQLRINAEAMDASGFRPSAGTVTEAALPAGPGVRADSGVAPGLTVDPSYDPLLAKLIVHGADLATARARATRALAETRIAGVATSVPLLRAIMADAAFDPFAVHTRWIEDILPALAARAGADSAAPVAHAADAPAGTVAAISPLQGKIVMIAAAGAAVRKGDEIAVLEALKMEHAVPSPVSGRIAGAAAAVGEVAFEGAPLLFIAPEHDGEAQETREAAADLDAIRPDLAEVLERHRRTRDEARPKAVARRRAHGRRTARENLDDLFDPGSFIEYGALALAAQRRRKSLEELIESSPADGLVCGMGAVNGAHAPPERARCMALAYDYTVLAGTQGFQNHRKTDRLFALAAEWRLPVVLFAEGGGGRPGDVDAPGVAGLDVMSFASWAALSGTAPRIGIAAGYCFAGNAALLGCSDIVIATRDSNIGMGGPAMIEGGGLGVVKPEEIGPSAVQAANGVIDVLAADEAEAVDAAKRLLGYFQGRRGEWTAADPRTLRTLIPENRLRAYDIRTVIDALADSGSMLELRRGYGAGMVTAFVRIEGRPFGLIANNPKHLGGAIDAEAAEKAARFLQLCDAFDLPIVSLVDTPGFMVGPDIERQAQVRRVSRMFIAGANLTVPVFAIALRKGYGLGAQAMAGGSFHAPFFMIAWPTAEFGGMGLEGAVRLGYRKELEAVADPAERDALYQSLVARMYAAGKGVSMASHFEIDAVIDPAETRRWILRAHDAVPPPPARSARKRIVEPW